MPRKPLKAPSNYAILGGIGALAVCIGLIFLVREFLAAPVTQPEPARADPTSRWKYIVVHHSASERGNAAVFDEWHRQRGWNRLGYHFVIGNGTGSGDGEVEVGPRWTDQDRGAHCATANGQVNEHGIGICLVGNFDQTEPAPAQLAALNKLIAELVDRYHIRPENILGHNEALIRAGETRRTRCPGKNLDMDAVRGAAPRR